MLSIYVNSVRHDDYSVTQSTALVSCSWLPLSSKNRYCKSIPCRVKHATLASYDSLPCHVSRAADTCMLQRLADAKNGILFIARVGFKQCLLHRLVIVAFSRVGGDIYVASLGPCLPFVRRHVMRVQLNDVLDRLCTHGRHLHMNVVVISRNIEIRQRFSTNSLTGFVLDCIRFVSDKLNNRLPETTDRFASRISSA